MKNKFIQTLTIGLFAAFALSTVLPVTAADEKKPAASATTPEKPKRNGMPFNGKLSAIDTAAKTISIAGKEKTRTFQLTDKTKIMKAGKAATLADAKVGDEVGGFAREEEGKQVVVSLRVGPKPAPKADGEKKADKPASK